VVKLWKANLRNVAATTTAWRFVYRSGRAMDDDTSSFETRRATCESGLCFEKLHIICTVYHVRRHPEGFY